MNRLQFEKSPYLQQHKTNPVEWYAWGPAALDKAVSEDKPILVSIGYSSCHWCHVMEHESFNDAAVAAFMNEHFVNIKIDREERPDLDKIYMDAVMALSGAGGWPLNCFLLPDKRPFYGGTYFPPTAMHQKPSWSQILQFIVQIYKEKRAEVESQAQRLTGYIENSGNTLLQVASQSAPISGTAKEIGAKLFDQLKNRFDRTWGGFGAAPKFPASMTQKFLLDYYFFSGDHQALHQVLKSLNVMARAGIYDQLGGGFARYATDKEWNVPHFEKMLYDNAQLLSLYSQAYKLAPHPLYKKVVQETAGWLMVDMKSPHGGFYSARDADSEHEEGKYYVWTYQEIQAILDGVEFDLFCTVYAIQPEGNWDDPYHPVDRPRNIIWVHHDFKDHETLCSPALRSINDKLLKHRVLRVPPLLDTKVITAWNALLCIGLLDAYDAFGEQKYLAEAKQILSFFESSVLKGPNYLHQFDSEIPAMLDDIAYSITAYIHAYRLMGTLTYLQKAKDLLHVVMTTYYDSSTHRFDYSITGSDLIAPVSDFYDNTMPSAIGMMAYNLVQLGRMTHDLAMEDQGAKIIDDLQGAIYRYPESLSHWASLLMNKSGGWLELKADASDLNGIGHVYLPLWIKGHQESEGGISLCHKHSCEMPVNSIQEFRLLLGRHYYTHEIL